MDAPRADAPAVLELRVRNHPGVMSHITGLFARRAFNLEAIVCVPEPGGETSRMWLLVAGSAGSRQAATPRLDQIERQLEKLHDVLIVRHRDDLDAAAFARSAEAVATVKAGRDRAGVAPAQPPR